MSDETNEPTDHGTGRIRLGVGVTLALILGFFAAQAVSAQINSDEPDVAITDDEREQFAEAAASEVATNSTDARIDEWEASGAVEAEITVVDRTAVSTSLESVAADLVPGARLFSAADDVAEDGDGNTVDTERFEYVGSDGRVVVAFWQEIVPEWEYTLASIGEGGKLTVDDDGVETMITYHSVSVSMQVHNPNTGYLVAATIEGGQDRPDALDGVDLDQWIADMQAAAAGL